MDSSPRAAAGWQPSTMTIGVAGSAACLLLALTEPHKSNNSLAWYVGGVLAAIVVPGLMRPRLALASLFLVCMFVYTVAPWVAIRYFDFRTAPFPSLVTVEYGTCISLRGILLIGAVLYLASLAIDFRRKIDESSDAMVDTVERLNVYAILLILAPCVCFVVPDWVAVSRIGVKTLLFSERREYADELITAEYHIAQIFLSIGTMVACVWLLTSRSATFRTRALVLLTLLFTWSPSILCGSRKLMMFVVVSVAPVAWKLASARRRKGYVAGAACLLVAMLAQPVLRDGRELGSFHEFILPNFMLFSLLDGVQLESDYWTGSALMLPAPLRPWVVTDIGTEYRNLRLTNTGAGGSPVAEAFLASEQWSWLYFAAMTLLFVFLTFLAFPKINPLFRVVALPYLLLWARSVFWVNMFFAVYGGIYMILILWFARLVSGGGQHSEETAAYSVPAGN